MAVIFKNGTHDKRYDEVLSKMKKHDSYHRSVAYLIALDDDCYDHANELFDFERDEIKPFGALYRAWQTGTSVHTTRLMFNLWNERLCCDYDKDESADEGSMENFTIGKIFSSCLARYYLEAIKLRYPEIGKID